MPREHNRIHRRNTSGGKAPKPVKIEMQYRVFLQEDEDDDLGGERDYMDDLFWLRHDLGFDRSVYFNW